MKTITRTVKKFGTKSEFTRDLVDDETFEAALKTEQAQLKGQAEKFMLDKGYCRTTEVRLRGKRDAVVGGCSEECGYCGKHKERIIPYLLTATVRGYYVGTKKVLERPEELMLGSKITFHRGDPWDNVIPAGMFEGKK